MAESFCWCGRVGTRLVYGIWRCNDHFYDMPPNPSPPPDVVEAARRTMKRFGELDGEAWKDVQAVCKWVLSHEAIDK